MKYRQWSCFVNGFFVLLLGYFVLRVGFFKTVRAGAGGQNFAKKNFFVVCCCGRARAGLRKFAFACFVAGGRGRACVSLRLLALLRAGLLANVLKFFFLSGVGGRGRACVL
ncbi:MAG: hypothetical protein QXW01_03785 [Candidatus Aenigmatarchaeota archaeon]